jgi:hypothetical protein
MNETKNSFSEVVLRFTMPLGETLEIRSISSEPIGDEWVGFNEETPTTTYHLFWNNNQLPWHTNTQLQATAIALGLQWGASEMAKKMRIVDER